MDGWTFGGWYTDKACAHAYDFSQPVTEDLTLYAKWTQKSTPAPAAPKPAAPTKPKAALPQTGDQSAGDTTKARALALTAGLFFLFAGLLRRRRGNAYEG